MYSSLRPQEALALRWCDIRERTILVERAVLLGDENDTKSRRTRRCACSSLARDDLLPRNAPGPAGVANVFPGPEGRSWPKTSNDN